MITTCAKRGISGVAVTALMLSGVSLAVAAPAGATGLAPTQSHAMSVRVTAAGPSVVSATRVELKVYISRVYRNLLQRNPEAAGLAGWISVLEKGAPRIAVSNGVTGSPEFRGGLINDAYAKYLGRLPDAAGMSGWQAAFVRGTTTSKMAAGLISSNEYYVRAGATDADFVRKLYRNVLGRTPGAGEVAAVLVQLRAGMRRDQVAMGFLLSRELLNTVVNGYYEHLLGRTVDSAGLRTWVATLQAGGRIEAVIGGIVSSQEYYLKR